MVVILYSLSFILFFKKKKKKIKSKLVFILTYTVHTTINGSISIRFEFFPTIVLYNNNNNHSSITPLNYRSSTTINTI